MKKFDCYFWIFLAFLSVPCFSQDSLVHFTDLQFYSEFERNAFLKQSDQCDFFSLFMANGGLLDDSKIAANREQFYNFIASLEYEKSAGKKNDKRMKPVYEAMHKRFLSKYEERNKFEEIFYNGYYNCVSASALYAIAFEKMNVPYIIKEEPNHVYLIVYPGEQQLTLQTTSPTGILKPVSKDLKERFVAMLQAQKLVTSKEVDGNVNGVFERYYFRGKADINLTQLAGIQYFNDGLIYFEEKNYDHAVKQFQKAYYLYPSQQIGYTLMMACYASFSNHETRDSLQAIKLARMSRFKRMGLNNRSFVNEFAIVTHDMLGQADSRDMYDGYYRTLVSHVNDSVLVKELSSLFHYEKSRMLYNRRKFKEAIPSIEEALKLDPKNEDLQMMLVSTLGNVFQMQSDFTQVERTLLDYRTRFPELEKHHGFNGLQATLYLYQFNIGYVSGKIQDGERYRALFQKLMGENPDTIVESTLVGQAYSRAAVYHYKKGQVAKAKVFIETGLKYAPGSYELIERQYMIR